MEGIRKNRTTEILLKVIINSLHPRRSKQYMKKENKNSIIIYSTADGDMKLEVRLENETVWLSQKQMAELFDCGIRNVSIHLRNVYDEAELSESQTMKDYFIVQKEGSKEVKRLINFYNLDVLPPLSS